MPKLIRVSLVTRGVSAIAAMQEDDAEEVCRAIWNALPLEGPAFHTKEHMTEVSTLVTPFTERELPLENPTVFPIPGDLLYFYYPPSLHTIMPKVVQVQAAATGVSRLAYYYGRNNYLLNQLGHYPGTIFATIQEGLKELAAASLEAFRTGIEGERLKLERVED